MAEPVAESHSRTAPLTKDDVIDRAIDALKAKIADTSFQGTTDEHFRAAIGDVVAEVRKATLDSLLLDTDALDGARHLMMWLDAYSRPTDRHLLSHCRMMGKKPPEECVDLDHVSPKSLRTYWILKAVVDEHRRLCAK